MSYNHLREIVSQVLDDYDAEIWGTQLIAEQKLHAIRSDLQNILRDDVLSRDKVVALLAAV